MFPAGIKKLLNARRVVIIVIFILIGACVALIFFRGGEFFPRFSSFFGAGIEAVKLYDSATTGASANAPDAPVSNENNSVGGVQKLPSILVPDSAPPLIGGAPETRTVKLPESSVVAIPADDMSGADNQEISEEIVVLEVPPEIAEEIYSPSLPAQEDESVALEAAPGRGGGPDEEITSESDESLSTSTSQNIAISTSTPATSTSAEFLPVVINEVAWAGTGTSSKARDDEWLELYNPNEFAVDMNGWQIISDDAKGPDIFISSSTTATTTILAKGFYLMERTDDTAVSEAGDWFGSFGNGLINSPDCEILSLYDKNNKLVDHTICLGAWPAGTANPDYKTMERVNPFLPADIPGNWLSNNGTIRNGTNVYGQPINGTPKAPNSVLDSGFIYLYPAASTTATSTYLHWTKSFVSDFKEYKIIRSSAPDFGATSTVSIATTSFVSYDDGSLELETKYYYKILACDTAENCRQTNVASTTTLQFVFNWPLPLIVFEIASSTEATSSESIIFDIVFDGTGQPTIMPVGTSTILQATTSENQLVVQNVKSRPYIFGVENESGAATIYFRYLKSNGWTLDKKIFVLPYEIDKFNVNIDALNTAHLAWLSRESLQKLYYSESLIE